jgi:hypothetical protein
MLNLAFGLIEQSYQHHAEKKVLGVKLIHILKIFQKNFLFA